MSNTIDAKSLRIVFMGTPEFASTSLRRLVAEGYNVVAVVTQPDKPAGRGLKVHESDVKCVARELGLPILQPEKLRDESFIAQLRELQPDLGIVIAFRMLPEVVWALPRLGTFNLHASLLPNYRGAAPINWAIMNGETRTGVTTFLLNHEIDKGAIIEQTEVDILPDENVGSLYDRLMMCGSELVTATVDRVASGDFSTIDQMHYDEATLPAAPKIFKEDCHIDWSRSCHDIHNHVRGLSPYPAAWTSIVKDDKEVGTAKIFATHVELSEHGAMPGELRTDGRSYVAVAANDGWVYIDEVQFAGKRRMAIRELLLGWRDVAEVRFA